MALVLDGKEYELLRASADDGMTLELWMVDAPTGPIAQVHYRDSDGAMTFTAFEQNVAFELIETLVSNAREALTPIADPEGAED